jgi:hypothetical protein
MTPTNHAHGSHHDPSELHNDDVAHEHSDINIRAVIMSTVVIVVVCVATAALMYVLFWYLEREAQARDPRMSPLAAQPTQMPPDTMGSPLFGGAPEPRLLTDEPRNLQQERERATGVLQGYGWVDEKGGVARIPIEEAKKLIVERGLPVRPDPVQDPFVGSRRPARGESSSGRVITNPPSTEPATAMPAPPAPAPASAPAHKSGH